MKRLSLALALALWTGAAASATDFGGTFTFTNLGFSWFQYAPIEAPAAYDPLQFLYGGSAEVIQRVAENISLEAWYSLDITQRSMLKALFRYNSGVVDVAIGPSFGLFNNAYSPLRAGFASELQVSLPGLFFVSFSSDSSLGSSLAAIGDIYQESTELSLGWYARNAICTLAMGGRKFQLRVNGDLVTTDSQNDYSFLVDIFKKSHPYNILLSLSYRTISKGYASGGTETKDSLGTVILGGDLTLHPARWFDLVLGLEGSIYTFAFDSLVGRGPAREAFLFGARIGFSVDTERFWDYRRRPSSVDAGDAEEAADEAAADEAATSQPAAQEGAPEAGEAEGLEGEGSTPPEAGD